MTRERFVEFALAVWAQWMVNRNELGWPCQAIEVVAFERSRTATVVTGVARWKGRLEYVDGQLVRHMAAPPPMPQETRPRAGPSIPPLDRHRLAPRVNRALVDLEERAHAPRTRLVVSVQYLTPTWPTQRRWSALGASQRTYWRHLNAGYAWLERELAIPVQ